MWCFFPLSGLYRQAARDPIRITDDKRRRLNAVLGTTDWEQHWYSTPHGQTNLFGDEASAIRTADVNAIEAYVGKRLASVFKGAVLKPLRIYNARRAPIASLFFAVSNPNPKAVGLAKRIAGNILKR
jgi:three-Cys-motif partner protein